MEEFFQKMNEDYVQKHFPNRSIFEGTMKKNKVNSIIVLVMLGIFFVASAYGAIAAVETTIGRIAENGSDGIGIGISIFMIVLTLIWGLLMKAVYKMGFKKHSDYIKDSAKKSKLPESEIENFEKQATASDAYILRLKEGFDRALSNTVDKDGVLTRDYVYIADNAQTIFRIADLKACFFVYYYYYVNNKRVTNLSIRLVSANGVTAFSDTTEKAGRALMAILLERNGSIETNGGNVMQENAFDTYYDNLFGRKKK